MSRNIESGPSPDAETPEKPEIDPEQKALYESLDRESLKRELAFIDSRLAESTPEKIEENLERQRKSIQMLREDNINKKQAIEAELERKEGKE